jgi:putative oxidoreductase
VISLRAPLAITVVRVATAAVLVIHGIARATLGIVDDFGGALTSWGFPAGVFLAWAITIVEIVGGLALAAGWAVRPLALWFAVQLLAGIVLIHGRVGWFVVGAGRNGMEFSVLLIVCLLAVALASREGYRLGSRSLNS